MELIIVWVGFAAVIAFWATSRGRSGLLFFLLSVFFSPILAAIVLLLSADLQKEKDRKDGENREHEKRMEELRALTASTRGDGAVSTSLADELQKLSELKVSGVLTEDEFQKQKEKLLGQGG